jgi:TRAP-type mannitol/chloroaromatic compound transport system permease small subunit
MGRSAAFRRSVASRRWGESALPRYSRCFRGEPGADMPKPIRLYVRYIDAMNRFVGRFAMRLLFVLAAVLLYSTFSRVVLGVPVNWVMEMSQFILSAYYLLGGAYSLQMDSHVRMDLFYSRMTPKNRAVTDAFTILFVMFYLGVLLWGGVSSTGYSWEYNQVNYTAWAPPLWPIKSIMTLGIFLMLLQVISTFFKDIALARGTPIA